MPNTPHQQSAKTNTGPSPTLNGPPPNSDVSLDAKLIAASNLAVADAVWHLVNKGDTQSGGFLDRSATPSMHFGMDTVEHVLERLRSGTDET